MSDLLTSIRVDCEKIIADGGERITLVFNKGCGWRGLGFGKGELLCEQHDGRRVYSFKVHKVLESLNGSCARGGVMKS